jgi:hypothetical protein
MSIASENLVGWWTLNETSGTTASDSSLYNRNSTLTGSLSFSSNSISAVLDKGLDFNGTDYVAIDSDADLPLGNEDRTIMAWINVSAYTGTMLTWGTESGGQRNEFGLRSGNKVVFAVNGCAYGTSSTPGVGAWYHAAIVFSGTHVSDVKIYINGDSKTVSIQAGADRTVNTVSNGVMQIGTDIDRTDHYDGDMDDIRIYNRVLSATEIQAIYQQGQ